MVFMILLYRVSHTHSCGFISFQKTRKFCLNFVGCTTPTRRNSRPTMRRVMNTASLIQRFFFLLQESCSFVVSFSKITYRHQRMSCTLTESEDSTLRRTRRTLSTNAPFSRAHVMNAHASDRNLAVKDVWIVCLRALVES